MNNFEAHILIVDDDDGIRTLVKKYLNEKNFLVTTASSAEEANEKVNIMCKVFLANKFKSDIIMSLN